jgi:membrane protein DedA with SNARE-associated domain
MESIAQLPVFNLISQFSYGAVFVISILANVVIPFPEEITLLFLGYLTGIGKLNLAYTLPVVIAGLFLSDCLIYGLARSGNAWVQKIYDKIFATRMGNHSQLVHQHIGKVIFISRFLVQLRFIGPYLAGHNKLSFAKFTLYNLSALIVYVGIFLGLGNILHKKVELLIAGAANIHKFIILLIATWIGYTLFKLFLKSSFWSAVKKSFE